MDISKQERFRSKVETYDREAIRVAPDLSPGDEHPSVTEVQKYLKRYGYLEDSVHTPGQLDDTTVSALRHFQQRFSIDTSGSIDDATKSAMSKSRCGLPDVGDLLEFATIGAWNRRNLTFAFGTLTGQVGNNVARDAVLRAFNTWRAAGAGLTFSEVAQNQNPDIFIEWRQAADPDHSMVGGVLAHADFPPGFSIIVNNPPLPLHYDDQEHTWVNGAILNGFDIETVALHEIGHCLGMLHTDVEGSVMFPFVDSNRTLRALQPDDVAGIRNLYPTPLAVGEPFGYAFVDGNIVEQHNLYRSGNGHIQALWFNFEAGWHYEDRSAMLPGVPPAVGDPFCYVFANKGTGLFEQHNLFRSGDGHIHALWFQFSDGWHHEDRTTLLPGVPPSVGKPFGYAFVDGNIVEQHNLFRSADGHIHALWFNFSEGWHHEDRTAMLPGVPPAVGDPFGYAFVNKSTGLFEQHNLFRAANGHIHALWFQFSDGWHHEDRTTILPGVPPAVGNPFGYTFVNGNIVEQHNLFRSADGHIHALWFNFEAGWHHEDRTAMLPGVPPAVGDPFGYTFVDGNIVEQHNLFRSADGHIHALWFNFSDGWHHEDRTAMLPGVPPAVGDPFGYAFVNKDTGLFEQHNLFRAADGRIHALWFNFAEGWHHEVRG